MDRALLVGINAYPKPNALQGCVNDVDDLAAFLMDRCGFRPEDVWILTDEQATARGILSALRALVAGVHPPGRLVFHYSGHGTRMVDGEAVTDCICPVDFDGSPARAITSGRFREVFLEIPPAVQAVWVSDSCHSGDLERSPGPRRRPRLFRGAPSDPGAGTREVRSFGSTVGVLANVALVSGCRSDQTAADAEFGGRPNGAATFALLQVLQGRDGLAIPLTRVVDRMRQWLAGHGFSQVPQLRGPGFETSQPFPSTPEPRRVGRSRSRNSLI
jgi:hypothetical protein